MLHAGFGVPDNKTSSSHPGLAHGLLGHLGLGVSLATFHLALPRSPPWPAFNLPATLSPTRRLGMEERPYSSRLKKIGELLEQDSVTREEVVSELGGQSPYTCHPSGSGLASGVRGEQGVVPAIVLPGAGVTQRQLCRVHGRF